MDDISRPPVAPPRERLSRRRLVRAAGAAAAAGLGSLVVGGTAGATSRGRPIGPAKAVPVGGSAAFTDPNTHFPSLVIQLRLGRFVAYDAVCPHEGRTVGYVPSHRLNACPCHGSEFNPATGARVAGPAPLGLTRLTITESGGRLFVRG